MAIKITDKAVAVLKGISVINSGVILRNDYLHTKFENTIEDSKDSKGVSGIVVNYDFPKDEEILVVDDELGIGNINEFLNLINTFDKESLVYEPKGTTISIKDNRKQNLYYTTTIDALPQRSFGGEEIFNAGESIIKFVLTDTDIEKIKQDLKIINTDNLYLKSLEGVLNIIGENSLTSNDTKIPVDSKMVAKAEGDFKFPTNKIFDVLIPGNYKFDIRKCDYDDDTLIIAKLENANIPGLSYIVMSDE